MDILKSVNEFIKEGGWLAVMLIVLFAGYFGYWIYGPTHRSRLEREEKATARERELTAASDARFDKAMLHIDSLSAGMDRLVQAVEKLAGKRS